MDLDALEHALIGIRRHMAMNNAFFRYHQLSLLEDPDYGNEADLVELFLDTRALLGRIQKSKGAAETMCNNLHFYDYKSCIIFKETNHWLGKYL